MLEHFGANVLKMFQRVSETFCFQGLSFKKGVPQITHLEKCKNETSASMNRSQFWGNYCMVPSTCINLPIISVLYFILFLYEYS